MRDSSGNHGVTSALTSERWSHQEIFIHLFNGFPPPKHTHANGKYLESAYIDCNECSYTHIHLIHLLDLGGFTVASQQERLGFDPKQDMPTQTGPHYPNPVLTKPTPASHTPPVCLYILTMYCCAARMSSASCQCGAT